MFNKKESIALFLSILALAFIFGFDDGSTIFNFSNWFNNFVIIFFLVVITVLFRELIIKWFASRHECVSEYKFWNIYQFWFNHRSKRGFPFGIILAIVLAFASAGKFFFTAIGVHEFRENKNARVGRKYQSLQYYEETQIVSMGILASLFLAVIGIWFGKIYGINMDHFVNINFFIALFNLIPISTLDGAKIFFGSLLTWIFLVIFVAISFLLITTSVIIGILIALIVASIAMGVYYWKSS